MSSEAHAPEVRRDLEEIDQRGFVVIERLLGPAALDEIRLALGPHLGGKHFGRNDFEGFHTERVYSIHPPFMGHAGGLHPKRHLVP